MLYLAGIGAEVAIIVDNRIEIKVAGIPTLVSIGGLVRFLELLNLVKSSKIFLKHSVIKAVHFWQNKIEYLIKFF